MKAPENKAKMLSFPELFPELPAKVDIPGENSYNSGKKEVSSMKAYIPPRRRSLSADPRYKDAMIFGCMELAGRSGHEVGRTLLQGLWEQHIGGALPEIALTDRGKPFFPESPWHFSISHTKRRVFCVLSRENVAIDAEETDRNIHPALAEKILSPGEKARFDAAEDRRAALLRFWVLKEAAAKLSGQGLRGYPNHTDFSPDDPRVFESNGCFVAILKE